MIGFVALLTSCKWGSGERTIYWDGLGNVTITRIAQGDENSNASWQMAACIAVPSSWSALITATASGTHQVASATTPFTTTLAAYPAGVIEINTHYDLQGYAWQCFADVSRDYAETDSGQVQFDLAPGTEVGTAFTTMGVVSANSDDKHFYTNIVAHQLLASDTFDDNWQRVNPTDIDMQSSNLRTFDTAEGTLIFPHKYDQGTANSPLYRLTDSGLEQLADMPPTSTLQYLNGLYISEYSYRADIGGNDQTWTDVRYSADLLTWSGAATLTQIGGIQWDPRDQLYVAIVNDYVNPQVRTTHQSTDLVNWASIQWIDRQAPTVAFLPDGTAVLETSNPSDPYWIRDAVTDDWTSLNITPTEGITGAVLLQVFMIESWGNRLHTTGLRKIDGVNEKVMYGYSDNGTDWTWSEIGAYSDVGLTLELTHFSATSLLYSSNSALVLSQDGGSTWQSKTRPTSLLNDDISSGVYQGGQAAFVTAFGGGYVGAARVTIGFAGGTSILFQTQDFENYELLTVSSGLQPISSLSELYFIESGTNGMVVQSLTAAAPDNDNDGISDDNDPDDDNDGVEDSQDAFRFDPSESVDTDGDGVGNNADMDDDGDGIQDELDTQPLLANNACTGSVATFASVVTSDVICGASTSIAVQPPAEVRNPGHLRLIAPRVVFENGFKATQLTVITQHSCSACAE